MRRLLQNTSLSAQLIGLTALCLVLISAAVLGVLGRMLPQLSLASPAGAPVVYVTLAATLAVAALLCLGLIVASIRHLLRPLRQLRDGMVQVIEGKLPTESPAAMPNRELADLKGTFDRMVQQLAEANRTNVASERALHQRTRAVDRLLEFSQAIQGAGQADQIYPALAHFLQMELGLAGLAILLHEPEAIPPIQAKASWPQDVLDPARPLGEMDATVCPSLRQNISKQFDPGGPPIRCSIDQHLRLPTKLAAYCIPFHIGRSTRGVAHLVLPAGEQWTEQQRQLAQTYVTTACSSLISLHLLAEAEKQSLTDALTGLYNRRSMEQLLQREVALAERHGHSLSVVMIDMDHFKQVNDVHGHAAGDHLLRAFADCVRITLRKTDLAFRYGGDEFVIALPQTPMAQAQAVVHKLRQAFGAVDFSHAITHLERQPTLSIGLAERSQAAGILTLQNLLWAADQAMYEAKNGSRNCVKVFQAPKAA